MRVLPEVNVNVNQESIRVTRRNEGVLSPQSVPVSVCGGVEAYNKSTPSASDSLGNTMPPGDIEDPGNARADFPNACLDISSDTPGFYSNLFLVRKASGEWRPVIDLKQLNQHIDAPHFHMHTISSVLRTV